VRNTVLRSLLLAIASIAVAQPAAALDADYWRGGWRTFTYRVTNNLQLDVRAGKGVSAASDNFFVGSGAVVRW
jgi:hypothetical protein